MTRPSIASEAPIYGFDSPATPCGTIFENVSAIGSIIPTFEVVAGTHTMFPDGKRTPPANQFAPVLERFTEMFEYAYGGFPEGLTTMIFEVLPGMHTTFPFGASTPP
jgi:hypothetical protein